MSKFWECINHVTVYVVFSFPCILCTPILIETFQSSSKGHFFQLNDFIWWIDILQQFLYMTTKCSREKILKIEIIFIQWFEFNYFIIVLIMQRSGLLTTWKYSIEFKWLKTNTQGLKQFIYKIIACNVVIIIIWMVMASRTLSRSANIFDS